jgi:hypothetical protein
MIFLSFFVSIAHKQFFFKYVAGGVGQQQQQQQRVLPLNSGARFSLAPPTVHLPQPGAPAPPGAGVIRTIRTMSGSAAGSGLFAAGMPPSKSSSVIVVQRAAGGAAAGGRLSRPTGVALYRPARPAANGQRIILDGGGGSGGGTVVRLAQSRPGSVSRQQPGGNVILLDLSHVADQTGGGGGSHGGGSEALVNFISGSGGGGAVDSAGNVTTLQRLGIVFLLF